MEQVIIKSIPRVTATKVSEFRNDSSGKKLNRTKLGRCKDKIRALYSEKTGRLLTGLSEYINNPYFGKTDLPQEFMYAKEKEQITRQEALEIKHGKPKGYYTDKPWTTTDGMKEENLTFFQKFKIAMNDGSTILDLTIPADEIAYYMLKASPFVAASMKQEDRIRKPKAEYYISDKNESIQEKYTKKQMYNDLIKKFGDNKFTPAYQRKVAKALGLLKGETSSMMDEAVYLLLDQYLEEGLKLKDENLTEFSNAIKLTESAEGREELDAICLLDDLVNYRIVNENRGTFTWTAKRIDLGQRKSDAIDFLLDPKKQPERDELEKQLKAKLLR